jgi:ATP-dependent helicase STH1/SNF2
MQSPSLNHSAFKASPKNQVPENSTSGWTKDQVLRAQAQVLMLRLLSRDAPIPQHVLRAAEGLHDVGERVLQQELKMNCTSLAMVDHGHYQSPDLRILNAQRDFVMSQRIRRRKVELAEIMPSLPARLNFQAELELHQLNVLSSQRAVRRELLNCNPLLSLPTLDSLKFYQQDRALGMNSTLQSEEEWKERKKAAQERALREAHEQHLASLKLHHEAFGKWMATVKEMRRKLCSDVKRYFVEKEREVIRQEQRRLQALRSGDMTKYREFLKEMKNQKLQDILDRTDKFLEKLGAKVHAGQEAHKQEDGAVAPATGDADGVMGDSERYKLQYKIVEKVETQPSILGGPMGFQLKGYQLIGLQWMVNLYNKRLSGILADEMGLGKTIQVVALVSYLVEIKQNNGPFLIIVPLSTMENWRLEFERWCPSLVVYTCASLDVYVSFFPHSCICQVSRQSRRAC